MHGAPQLRREGEKELPAFLPRRFPRPRWFFPAILAVGLAGLFWPARELRSDNFVFYLPSGHHLLPLESVGNSKYLPLMQILNVVGKVEGIQEKKNSVKVWFGTTQIEMRQDDATVRVERTRYQLLQPARLVAGQWLVPLDFLTVVLPHLIHQAVEYQEGTDRIFIGDVKPASFTVRVDPIANGVRLTVQFTDRVSVRTASSNGKWVMFLGDHPMEPMEPSYRFQNPYLSDLKFDDQDGAPKLILSPTSNGLNIYPMQAEGGKILLADVVKPPAPTSPAVSARQSIQSTPTPAPPTPAGQQIPQVTEESPAAPPGPPLPVVALDAGHGGENTGGHSRDGILEKDLVAQYVARVRTALLATEKYRVVLCRPGDATVSFEQRALAANVSSAACFVSFHAGDLGAVSPRIALFTFQPPSPPADTASDTSTAVFLPWGQVQEAHVGQSLQLALAVQQQLALINGVQADLPVTAPVRTLRNVNAPAVAIELGRLAPDADATALVNPTFQQQVAAAVVNALAGFVKGGN